MGQARLNAAQLSLFDVAKSGFELVPRDTAGTSAGARAATESVLEEGVQLVLGPVFADAVRVTKPIARAAGINVIAFSTDWSLAGDNTFLMGFMPYDQINRILAYAATQDLKRMGLLTPEDDYGRVVSNLYRQAADKNNIRTIAKASVPHDAGYMDPAIRTLTRYDQNRGIIQAAIAEGAPAPKSVPPAFDAVLLPMSGHMAIAAAKILTKYDAPPQTVRRLGTGLMDDPSLLHERNLNGAWFAAPDPNLRQRFENRFFTTYGYKPPRLATLAYDAASLATILAQQGFSSTGRPAFDHASISNQNGFFGVDGIFRFRRNGTAERGLAFLEIQNGRALVIDPGANSFVE